MSGHDAPPEIEPRTPVWLTVVGACLLLALAVFWLSPRSEPTTATVRVLPAGAEAAGPADEDTAERAAPVPTAARAGIAPAAATAQPGCGVAPAAAAAGPGCGAARAAGAERGCGAARAAGAEPGCGVAPAAAAAEPGCGNAPTE